jgi:hypothetical protein
LPVRRADRARRHATDHCDALAVDTSAGRAWYSLQNRWYHLARSRGGAEATNLGDSVTGYVNKVNININNSNRSIYFNNLRLRRLMYSARLLYCGV